MLDTTVDAVKAILRSDPTVGPGDRSHLLMLLRKGADSAKPHPATPTEPRLLRRAEAAQRLSVSLRTVDKLGASGALKKRKLPGRTRAAGFLESDVTALVAGKAD